MVRRACCRALNLKAGRLLLHDCGGESCVLSARALTSLSRPAQYLKVPPPPQPHTAGNGVVDAELRASMKALGHKVTDDDIQVIQIPSRPEFFVPRPAQLPPHQVILSKVDTDSSGSVEWCEFMAVLEEQKGVQAARANDEDTLAAFVAMGGRVSQTAHPPAAADHRGPAPELRAAWHPTVTSPGPALTLPASCPPPARCSPTGQATLKRLRSTIGYFELRLDMRTT